MNFQGYLVSAPMAVLAASLSMTAFADDQAVVNVILKEWHISSDAKHVKSGPVTFKVSNKGEEEHEIVFIKTDLAPDMFPVHDGKVIEDQVGDVIGEIEDFLPDTAQEITFDLTPGHYVLFCNIVEQEEDGEIESHYHEGMRVALSVE